MGGSFGPKRHEIVFSILFREASEDGKGVVISLIELTSTIIHIRSHGEILELLRYCVDGLRLKPGCVRSGFYEAGDQNETILYLERWKSAEELYRHIQSDLYLAN